MNIKSLLDKNKIMEEEKENNKKNEREKHAIFAKNKREIKKDRPHFFVFVVC